MISAPFELNRIRVPLRRSQFPLTYTCPLFVRCAIVDSEWPYSYSRPPFSSASAPPSAPTDATSLSSRFLRVNRLHRRHSKSRLRLRHRRRVAQNGRFLSTPIFPMSTRRAAALSIFYPICGWVPHRVAEVGGGDRLRLSFIIQKRTPFPPLDFNPLRTRFSKTGC